jgi:subtilisin family serine protease
MTVVAAVDQAHPDASFPSSIDGVLPVADERLSARAGSVYIAPGLDIPTTEPEGTWSLVNGSSYAAAHVSGLAALLRQASGHQGLGRSARSAMGSHGLIDACAALARVSALDAEVCRTRN